MLSSCIYYSDCLNHWVFKDGIWRSENSLIAPCHNPAVEYFAITDGSNYAFVVREKGSSSLTNETAKSCVDGSIHYVSKSAYNVKLAELYLWPLDFKVIEIRSSSEQGTEIVFSTGYLTTSPLYVTGNNDFVRADWDLVNLYPTLSGSVLDKEM